MARSIAMARTIGRQVGPAKPTCLRTLSESAVANGIETLLRNTRPAVYCDQCLAMALCLPADLVRIAAERLGKTSAVVRKAGRCTSCRSAARRVTRLP
jgi:Zn finger protein HypA/HybF involved in hydrogenase expression